MHDRSPNRTALVAAISARALAQAARRAGYRVLAADFFEDLDTLAAASRTVRLPGSLHQGIDAAAVPAALQRLADGEAIDCLVLGSGFERLPGLVEELGRQFPLAGSSGAAIARVKDPEAFAADCAALGIPHPETRREPPADPENWLVKTQGGAGGAHIRPAGTSPGGTGHYFQRRLVGTPLSALFVAHRGGAALVGFSRQWQSPAPGAPYRYGGAVRLARFPRAKTSRIAGWLDALSRRIGLSGLCSADFIRTAAGCHILEINPRPGATLDIFDTGTASETGLFEVHVRACRGEPFAVPRPAGSAAASIAFADRGIERLPAFAWPDWTADRQAAGSRLAVGDPICTVFGRGRSAAAARRDLDRNLRRLSPNWIAASPKGGIDEVERERI